MGGGTLNYKVSKQKANLLKDLDQASRTINIPIAAAKYRPMSSPPTRVSNNISPEQQKEVPLNIELAKPRTPAVEPEP